MGRGLSICLATLCVLTTLCVVGFAAPAYAGAVTCSYDSGVVTVVASGDAVIDRTVDGVIRAGGVACGAATVTNTDLVNVDAGGSTVTLNVAQPFAPGATAEPDGQPEIEVAWSGGGVLVVRGGPLDDNFRWTADGVHLDGDTDADVTGVPAALRLFGGDGADLVDLTSGPVATDAAAYGEGGDDVLRGHAGPDQLDGGEGNDTVVDGLGTDFVRGGDGDDVLLAAETVAAESSVATAIPDGGTLTQSLTIPPLDRGTDLAVRLTATHDAPSTLAVQLVRGGTTVALTRPASGWVGAAFGGGRVGGLGTTRTDLPLTLRVTDTAADGVTGTLAGWSVTVTGAGPAGVTGADSYDGGAGSDTLSFAARRHDVTIDATAGTAGETGEGDVLSPTFESLSGGWGRDTIVGSPRNEGLHGDEDVDVLRGNGGDDVYDCGGNGGDTATFSTSPAGVVVDLALTTCRVVYGSEHDDVIFGTVSSDTIYALGGDDTIVSNEGYDTVDAGDGDDVVDERRGADFETDTLAGGAGYDLLTYAGRSGAVAVGYPEPIVRPHVYVDQDVTSGFEALTGGNGDDVLYGNDADNVISGGPGNDQLAGRGGADSISGGSGRDLVDYGDRTLPLRITLDGVADDGEVNEGDNAGADVEDVYGGQTTDVIVGNASANALWGWGGADVITGGPGADRLDGGADPDIGYRDASDTTYDIEVLLPP